MSIFNIRNTFLALLFVTLSASAVCSQEPEEPKRRPIPAWVSEPMPDEQRSIAEEMNQRRIRLEPELLDRMPPRIETEANAPIPGIQRRSTENHLIYRCLFDNNIDTNLDLWPDGWSRTSGIGFPEYTRIEIAQVPNPVNFRALQINVEGGGTLVKTPHVPVSQGLSYTARSFLQSKDLVHNLVTMQMLFFDSKGKLLATHSAEPIQRTSGWKKREIGPIAADFKDVATAQIAFHVAPQRREDWSGLVEIAGVELEESPTVVLRLPNQDHIFFDNKGIEVQARVSGLTTPANRLQFLLEDAFGRVLERMSIDMEQENSPDSAFVLKSSDEFTLFQGRGNWTLPIQEPGFYRVRLLADGLNPNSKSNETSLVVLRPEQPPIDGEFGWSLQNRSLDDLKNMRVILTQSGLSWLKLPVWFGNDATQGQWEEFASLCEWFTRTQNLRLVGILADPPKEVRDRITNDEINAAAVFSLSSARWYPSIETSFLRLPLIRYWQIGHDEDRSLIEIDPLFPKVEEIHEVLSKVAVNSSIGFGWDWNRNVPETFLEKRQEEIDRQRRLFEQSQLTTPLPPGTDPPEFRIIRDGREFLSLSSGDALTHLELGEYLNASEHTNCERFVTLRPISREDYTLENRLVDLVQRMLSAKVNGAKATFIPEPQDDATGLINADGTPGELFLPWRTTALMISGRESLGSLTLPNHSNNLIFDGVGRNDAVMVLWNDAATESKPIDEVLYLGPECERVDVWGKRTKPYKEGKAQMISVGPIPVFVTGLNRDVIRFRQQFSLEKNRIPSQFGSEIPNSFTFTNTTFDGIGGTITLSPPEHWKVSPVSVPLNLPEGESENFKMAIQLTPKSVSGPHTMRFDATLEGVPPDAKEFSIYEPLHVGEGGIYIEPPITQFNPRTGEMEVRMALINDTDRIVSFRCVLRTQGVAPQTQTIFDHGFGRKDLLFKLPNGQRFLGAQFTITASEIGGTRTLQSKFQGIR